ncbi:hypothetical protein K470DRAFT_262172 [Piedraia hortae CBS 480.64]|uniref:Uncharacterized protein n=1 Tax=Piedraia hortae CBS 480.64 TaxID=1314780 RepID=A0A6A7C863_9PEZI|nr:hypothetical protein K470DRAFT_262172 [Piedraia hortae CBS 480.64]
MADRSNNRSLKPTVASSRGRPPLTPRLATTACVTSRNPSPRPPTNNVTPKVRARIDGTPRSTAKDSSTPRFLAQRGRAASVHSSPLQAELPSESRPKLAASFADEKREAKGLRVGGGLPMGKSRPRSEYGVGTNTTARSTPALGHLDASRTANIDNRFFRANESSPDVPMPKKPAFVYADGKEEEPPGLRQRNSFAKINSPSLSAVSENRFAGPWIRLDSTSTASRSPPQLSPTFSSLSNVSPILPVPAGQLFTRPPSPNKENIHLSYRKGASQIIGTCPVPRVSVDTLSSWNSNEVPQAPTLHLSPSTLSVDSACAGEEDNSGNPPPPPQDLVSSPTELTHPQKSSLEIAADARHARKVLDLEISNSSLLAINASLERQMRKQKAELKRLRRLSMPSAFSFKPKHVMEEGESIEEEDDDCSSRPSDMDPSFDNVSGDESVDNLDAPDGSRSSSGVFRLRESDPIRRDEKRFMRDMQKHKELLTQSQMVNQSIRRCMNATEEMIKEGQKALAYRVRVSDVKMGGRVLHPGDDESHTHDEAEEDEDDQDEAEVGNAADEVLRMWKGVGVLDADGDSGIEADKPLLGHHPGLG